MAIEEQVLTIEQMNHLKELGFEVKDTALYWVVNEVMETWFENTVKYKLEINNGCQYADNGMIQFCIPTLTLQEIEDILPNCINGYFLHITKDCIEYELPQIGLQNDILISMPCNHPNNRNAIIEYYRMLCWVIENNYVKSE